MPDAAYQEEQWRKICARVGIPIEYFSQAAQQRFEVVLGRGGGR